MARTSRASARTFLARNRQPMRWSRSRASGLDYTPDNLALAHQHAISKGLYQPLRADEIEASYAAARPADFRPNGTTAATAENNPDGTQRNSTPGLSTGRIAKKVFEGGGLGKVLLKWNQERVGRIRNADVHRRVLNHSECLSSAERRRHRLRQGAQSAPAGWGLALRVQAHRSRPRRVDEDHGARSAEV